MIYRNTQRKAVFFAFTICVFWFPSIRLSYINPLFTYKNNSCVDSRKVQTEITADTSGRLSEAGILYSLETALLYLNAPDGWKKDPFLLLLIQKESEFNPRKQNQTSSAFGLFQMIKKTWSFYLPEVPYGTIDPVWQSIGGIRYIMKTYKTPSRAFQFRQATLLENEELAPEDLKPRARIWIDQGLHGY